MSVTARGRAREFHTLARRYLNELRSATRGFAPPERDGWYSEYALGFAAAHVGIAAGLAKHGFAFAWFSRWPRDEDILPVVDDLVPECLGLEHRRFNDAFQRATESRKRSDSYHAMNLGVGMGHTVSCLIQARTSVRRDYFGVRVMEMEAELRRLPAPTLFGRLTGYRPFRLVYRYMVMRTLGETVFGLTTDQATRFALDYEAALKRDADAKTS